MGNAGSVEVGKPTIIDSEPVIVAPKEPGQELERASAAPRSACGRGAAGREGLAGPSLLTPANQSDCKSCTAGPTPSR